MENFIPNPPMGLENDLEAEHVERALHDLVGNDDFYEEVEARLENANERDASGYALLHVASWSHEKNPRILQLLLERGSDVDSTAKIEYTPLHFAAANRNRCAVAALIEAGASVNSRDVLGRTALHFAISQTSLLPLNPIHNLSCDMWILERLLDHPDTNPNLVNKAGMTPLMWAVRAGNSDAVGVLLRKGADPNIPNGKNETPLHLALSSAESNDCIVCTLLSKGAAIYREDRHGRTPMDLFLLKIKDYTNDVAQHVVWWSALRYNVRLSVVEKLKEHRRLYKYYKRCRREVRHMKNQIVYGNFTLHDFACDSFHVQVDDPLQDIYMPVVRILLSGSYAEYLDFILKRMSTRDLCRILQITSGAPGVEDLFTNSMHLIIYWAIKTLHYLNAE